MPHGVAQDLGRPPTVADRLRGARQRGFVGRRAELELFRDALRAPEPPFTVLWIHGPGGVGKTALLGALAEAAGDGDREPLRVDLRAIEPTPPAFLAEVGGALAGADRPVLLLDTFEVAGRLEDWLREEFLPGLPAGALLVVASRDGPAEAWRRDPGWRDLLRVISLRNLPPDDARAFLHGAGVPERLHDQVLELTHGHPLALSLLLDVLAQDGAAAPGTLDAVPDVVGRLVASFLARVPSARHRRALEIAAHARATTGPLLRSAFSDTEGDALFGWLRELSFIECGPHGLFPHDLAREVIDADLRWRDPTAYAEVHAAVRCDVIDRVTTATGRDQQRALADLMFLHRGNPSTPAFWDWDSLGHVYADALRPGDREAVLAMVERHEGPESAALAAHWLDAQPSAFAPFREHGPAPVGFIAQLALHDADEAAIARDPAARAALAHAHRHAPPRPGEEVLLARFAMDRDAYQAPSRSLNVVTTRTTQEWVSRPRLAWYYLSFADPDAMAPMMHYIDFQRVPEADFEVGGHTYATFARDWRRDGGARWLEMMGGRELHGDPGDLAPEPAAPPALALSQPEFARAVRRALRDLHRPDDLAANPLARSRMVRACEEDAPGDGLCALVEEAIASLRADPRDAKLARALERTYVRPAPTQEAAAEVLGLPFSTYRGHLTRGVEHVVDRLWQRELYG